MKTFLPVFLVIWGVILGVTTLVTAGDYLSGYSTHHDPLRFFAIRWLTIGGFALVPALIVGFVAAADEASF